MSGESENVVELRAGEGRDWEERDGFAQHFMRMAGGMVSNFPTNLHGVVIVGVDEKGNWSVGWRVREDSPIGQTMLGGLAIAAVTKDMLADPTVGDALVRNGLVLPAPDDAS